MWYIMLDVMSMCYDLYTTGYDGAMLLQELLQAPYAHLPIYQLSPAMVQRRLT